MRHLLLFLGLCFSCSAQLNITSPFYVAGVLKSPASAAFDPSQISGILQFNYGDGDASGAGLDNTWTATVGRDATSDGGGARPNKSTSLISGKSFGAYHFHTGGASGCFFTNVGGWQTTADTNFSRFMNFRLTNIAVGNARFFCSAPDDAGRADLRMETSPKFDAYHGGSFSDLSGYTPETTSWHIMVQIVDGVNTRMQLDGGAWTTTPMSPFPGAGKIHGVCVGALWAGGVVDGMRGNIESFGVIDNTNYHTWGANLTNWMHGRLH